MDIPNHLLTEVGFAALKKGEFESAETLFEALKENSPNDATGAIGAATIAIAQGDMKHAIAELEDIAFSNSQNAREAQKLLLIASMLDGDKSIAAKAHQSLIDNHSDNVEEGRQKEASEFFGQ